MASEDIGSLYNTKIPGYEDAADIQAALKLFLYGSTSYDTTNTDPTQLPNPSLARHIQGLVDRVEDQENLGVGSEYSNTIPALPEDGYIWVDSTSAGEISLDLPTALYQNSAPTANTVSLSSGLLWVDKDSSPLKMYVYDTTLGWREIGA